MIFIKSKLGKKSGGEIRHILGRELGSSGISLNNTLGENLPSRH